MRKTLCLLMCVLCVGWLDVWLTPVWGDFDLIVQQVVLSEEIDHRNPEKIFSPPAFCERDKNGKTAIPSVQSSETSKIVLWTKIESTITGSVRHTWHHQVDGTWQEVSSVNLKVRPSSGFRTWSIRTLRPERDKGEWMVVVAPSPEPDRILCITRFTIR